MGNENMRIGNINMPLLCGETVICTYILKIKFSECRLKMNAYYNPDKCNPDFPLFPHSTLYKGFLS